MIDDNDFDSRMRQALRPVPAPSGLASRILAKAAARQRPNPMLQWAAIAAALLLAVAGGSAWSAHRAGQQVEQQFRLAMNITSRKVSSFHTKLIIEIPVPQSGQRQ